MDPAQSPIRASTQEHLSIEDIRDDIVILKDGSCCLILQTTAVNFDLLSESEQDAIIYAYSGLLNSLSFPIQIFIRSQKKDISNYLNLLKQHVQKQKTTKLSELIKDYQSFIEKTVKESEVLDKSFYIVIPFSNYELGVSQSIKSNFMGKPRQLPFPKEFILAKAKTSLFPKKDHLIQQFNRLGLRAIQLNSKQIIELFYIIYNPESQGHILGQTREYDSFLVEPSLKEAPLVQKPVIANNANAVPSQTLAKTQKLNKEIDQMINIHGKK